MVAQLKRNLTLLTTKDGSVAHLGWTYHDRSRIRCKPSFSVTSAGAIANGNVTIHSHKSSHTQRLRTSRQILLVREHKQQTLLHLPIAQYPVKLLLCLINSLSILTVDNKYEALCSCIVMSPEGTNLILSSDIPYIEFHVLIRHSLHIKTNCESLLSESGIINDTKKHAPVGIVVTDWFNFSL